MIRRHKKYSWPRKLYDSLRIKSEDELVKSYGLKNKREIWKAEAKVKYFRDRAKSLITSDQEEQKQFFAKLNAIGFKVSSIADVLALTKEDLLKRRLASYVAAKGYAKTPREARQMITHRKVKIEGRVVNSPSYIVSVSDESTISVVPRKQPVKEVAKIEEEIVNEEA